jgi:glycosyltransferase involved in cell wall biosynthesis
VIGANFIGDLMGESGLHEAGRLILKALQSVSVPITYFEVAWGDARAGEEPARVLVPEGAIHREVNLLFYNVNILKSLGPRELDALTRAKPLVAYWFWEMPRIPASYAFEVSHVDDIWVPSRFVQQAFAASFDRPTTLVPLPAVVDPDPNPSRAEFGLPDGRWVFLFTFSFLSNVGRKNPFGLVDAFRAAFGRTTQGGPLLVIKAHRADAAPEAAAALRARVEEVGGVLITEQYSRRKLDNLLACADAYISLHRAEGYGLGLLESMALGKPVIATAYSGNVDFTNDLNSYLVPYTLRTITAADHALQPGQRSVYEPGQIWAEPDQFAAAETMQRVFQDPDAARQRGEIAALFARTRLSPMAVGREARRRLERCDRSRMQYLVPEINEQIQFDFEFPPPGFGWHDREAAPIDEALTFARWTAAVEASFWTKVKTAVDYQLTIVIRAAISDDVLASARVTANGIAIPIEANGVPPRRRLSGIIRQSVIGADGRLELRICVDRVVSPQEIGLSDDPRKLGVSVGFIGLQPITDSE